MLWFIPTWKWRKPLHKNVNWQIISIKTAQDNKSQGELWGSREKEVSRGCLVYGAQRRARHLWAGALGPGTFHFRSFPPPEDSRLPFSTVMAAEWWQRFAKEHPSQPQVPCIFFCEAYVSNLSVLPDPAFACWLVLSTLCYASEHLRIERKKLMMK